MKSKSLIIFLAIFATILLANTYTYGYEGYDEATERKLEKVLSNIKNYRFGSISIYELGNTRMKALKEAPSIKVLESEDTSMVSSTGAEPACITSATTQVKLQIENDVKQKKPKNNIWRDLPVGFQLSRPEFDCIYNYYFAMHSRSIARKNLRKAYLITTRAETDGYPSTIIALILSFDNKDYIVENIRSAKSAEIFTYQELNNNYRDTAGSESLYRYVEQALVQGDVINKTREAQGFDGYYRYFPPVTATSKSLVSDESNITNVDIQRFLRISDIQPTDFYRKRNELLVSGDLISWRLYNYKYEMDWEGNVVTDANGYPVIDTLNPTNDSLPRIGLEMKYGIDDINYPSLWSERVTASALWKSVKLGVILPTSLWSDMSKDVFDQQRKMTHAGLGIAGAMDFPFGPVAESGVFHLGFGYVFGNAKDTKVNQSPESDSSQYLVRLNAQLHYTFGISIDKDYIFRFGIGPTVYNVEKWKKTIDKKSENENLSFMNIKDETIGGLSGKIEFMSKNLVSPWGMSLQYFDEALMAYIWLQIPVIENTFSLRLDAKGSFVAFREQLHAWENRSLFTPMARLIFYF